MTQPRHDNAPELTQRLQRMRSGSAAAMNDLLDHSVERLRKLARKMLRGFPAVRRWAQTDDVLQSAMIRLVRALREVGPACSREFFALAATQIRRELIDLARHHMGPQGAGARHASGGLSTDAGPREDAAGPGTLAEWGEFHRLVDALEADERAVIELMFYQGFNQTETADLLGIAVRTVQRRRQSALLNLHRMLGEAAPAE